MNQKIEFIESYRKFGNDYQWSDNHGELVRCKDCKYWHEVDSVEGTTFGECKRPHPIIRKSVFLQEGWYCADGERKDDAHE